MQNKVYVLLLINRMLLWDTEIENYVNSKITAK